MEHEEGNDTGVITHQAAVHALEKVRQVKAQKLEVGEKHNGRRNERGGAPSRET